MNSFGAQPSMLKIEVFSALQMGFGTSKKYLKENNPSKHNPHV
jgi:hypothetical protein